MNFELAKLRRGLEALRADRAAMTIHAPVDGIVYYGKFTRGQWENAASLSAKLLPDGTVSPDEVFLTIVKPGPLSVRVQIDEKDVALVKPGLEGKTKMTAHPDLKVAAKVTNIAAVPTTPGKFEALVALEYPNDAPLAPGMACSVKLVPYSRKDAVVVPASAVYEENDQHFVALVAAAGKSAPHPVTVGHTRKDEIEILKGLRAGDEILLDRPAGKKSASPKESDEE
jgi:HlyD family secretion protein